MLIQTIGQFLLAVTFAGLAPVDAAQIEWRAGVANGLESGLLPVAQAGQVYGALPVADVVSVDYPRKVDAGSYGIVTTAPSALVMDAKSGMILLAERPDQLRSIGSVTKLMSALVFLDSQPNLTERVELNANLDIVYGGRIYLRFGDGLQLRDVFAASLVGSDNSATQSLVRFSGMTEEQFVSEMNRKALELGMESTTFADPTGIDPNNISTARDLIRLLVAAERRPEMKPHMMARQVTITQESGYTVTIDNTNQLLESYLNEDAFAVEAGKTGYLPQAGYVLATTIREGAHKVHVVVLGAETPVARFQEAKGLAAWAFKVFEWPDER